MLLAIVQKSIELKRLMFVMLLVLIASLHRKALRRGTRAA